MTVATAAVAAAAAAVATGQAVLTAPVLVQSGPVAGVVTAASSVTIPGVTYAGQLTTAEQHLHHDLQNIDHNLYRFDIIVFSVIN